MPHAVVNIDPSQPGSFTSETLCFVSEPTVDPSIANCDFENGLCLYYQERAENNVWNRVSVKPNAYRIGDHTTGAGEWPWSSSGTPGSFNIYT